MQSIAMGVRMSGAAAGAVAALGTVMSAATAARAAVTAELRIVERTGQGVASPGDNVLNFAVQARVTTTSGPLAGLAGYSYSITINGESESFGTLTRDRVSNPDGTYFGGIAGPAGGGSTSGSASQFYYYANLNSSFNGLINSSAATWTQSPASQDIGLILGSNIGQYLLSTPGVDADSDGNPDTAIGNDAVLPASVMHDYFGAGEFIDIFRFRYTVTNFTPRNLDIRINGDTTALQPFINTFTQVHLATGLWGPVFLQPTNQVPSLQNLSVQIIPAPAAIGALLAPAALLLRRRRTVRVRV